jgi:hypothetical protein
VLFEEKTFGHASIMDAGRFEERKEKCHQKWAGLEEQAGNK